MTRALIATLLVAGVMLGLFFYVTGAERAKLQNANTQNTIEGIRDARTIENETRNASDDDLRGILTDGVRR